MIAKTRCCCPPGGFLTVLWTFQLVSGDNALIYFFQIPPWRCHRTVFLLNDPNNWKLPPSSSLHHGQDIWLHLTWRQVVLVRTTSSRRELLFKLCDVWIYVEKSMKSKTCRDWKEKQYNYSFKEYWKTFFLLFLFRCCITNIVASILHKNIHSVIYSFICGDTQLNKTLSRKNSNSNWMSLLAVPSQPWLFSLGRRLAEETLWAPVVN